MSTTLLLVDLASVAVLAIVGVVIHAGRRSREDDAGPTRGVVDLAFGVLITLAIACIMVWLAGVVPSFR